MNNFQKRYGLRKVAEASAEAMTNVLLLSLGSQQVSDYAGWHRKASGRHLWLVSPSVHLCAGQRKMSKNQKKKRRGQDAVDEAFAEAEAGLDARARRQQQSAMLEALFEIFFRVLKHCSASSKQQGEPQTLSAFGTAAYLGTSHLASCKVSWLNARDTTENHLPVRKRHAAIWKQHGVWTPCFVCLWQRPKFI